MVVVVWAMQKHLTQDLVMKALQMALKSRKPCLGLLFHFDRGSASHNYQCLPGKPKITFCEPKGVFLGQRSDAKASFTLKVELVYNLG